jgi:hypothetical protein
LPENLPQFDFQDFPRHPMEMKMPAILNIRRSANAVDLNQASIEARQLVHLYLSFDSGICRYCW